MSSVVFTINHPSLPGDPSTVPPQPAGTASITYTLADGDLNRVFAMLLATAAPITRQRQVEVDDPANPGQQITVTESYQDTRTLGECMKDETGIFVAGLQARVVAYEFAQAQAAIAPPAPPAATPSQ